MRLLLKNGIVYDPLNNIKGEKMDILIENGKIVEKFSVEKDVKVIDCSNKIIMPGGVEIHSHIAGGKVNSGRVMRPEDHRYYIKEHDFATHSGTGYSLPTTWLTGYLYAKMGYTFAATPAMPPLSARHTHEELRATPIIDKVAYTLFGNNWFVFKYVKEKNYEKLASFVSFILRSVKGFAVKLVNPGGDEAWAWGGNVKSLDDIVPNFDITPREIIEGLIRANELLKLPHSIHLHTINLGRPGNYKDTIDTIRIAGKFSNDKRQVMHLTHIQFHSYGGSSWKDFESKSEEIVKELERNRNVTFDIGFVLFGETTTMTADGPMEYYLSRLTGLKWQNLGIEIETSPGVTPIIYRKSSPVHSIQFAIGLEIALLSDPWRYCLTTDHPNGAPFVKYPEIIALLMSRKYREEVLKTVNQAVKSRAIIESIDRELDFYEIAIITRASPAKILGLDNFMGSLKIGYPANVAVYDINPENYNYRNLIKAFSNAYLTIKDGNIVVKEGKVLKEIYGKTYYVDAKIEEEIEREIYKDLDYYFKRFYSVNLANYPVDICYLTNPIKIETKAEIKRILA